MTQKELILLSLLLADTPKDRHEVYTRRKPKPIVPLAHYFVMPSVTEVRNGPEAPR